MCPFLDPIIKVYKPQKAKGIRTCINLTIDNKLTLKNILFRPLLTAMEINLNG